MKIRVTNNSEVELNDVTGVFPTIIGYRLTFKDGSAKQYRRAALTTEAKKTFAEMEGN